MVTAVISCRPYFTHAGALEYALPEGDHDFREVNVQATYSIPGRRFENMGTRGYLVYRHSGHYFIHYNHWDSYPRVYGLEVLTRTSEGSDFPDWLARMHCRPPRGEFLDYISHDHYGNLAYASHTPQKYRYSWKRAPPPVEDRLIHAYRACTGGSSPMSAPIHELLDVRETLSNLESVWVRLLESAVGCLMFRYDLAFKAFESRRGRDELTKADLALGLTIVGLGLPSLSPFQGRPALVKTPRVENGIWWAQKDICVFVTTHLDDERNFQAAIADAHAAVMEASNTPNVVCGVVTSTLRLVVIRVDKSVAEGAVRHTAALQFLPSFYATSPSTPGITALMRLGIFTHIIKRPRLFPSPLPLSCPFLDLPTDILGEISKHLTDPRDLHRFSALSDAAFLAAELLLKYPRLENLFLYSISAASDSAAVYEEVPEDESGWHPVTAKFDRHIPIPHSHLATAKFNSIVDSKPAVATLEYNFDKILKPEEKIGMPTFWPVDCTMNAYVQAV
ncbi:hypothetical protein BOTBODRAFT_635824 [Botryobasidium botryosum FD-172 SS1]|uniref:F-box domain-containing protein n=1 Tax=Botryobasidium botryosum (strain FD-172 SS1) TaxID=930990 RepID=A0A067MX68_BOTB1|nr:hypothetical protein BOTBODRAFT_635824 [Botryobasidium botryosum FD-172 SS1]